MLFLVVDVPKITDSRMADVLRGSPWEILRTFLSLDILLPLRTTERFWNKGDKHGTCGDIFRYLLLSDEGHNAFPLHQGIATLLPDSQSSGSTSPDVGDIWGYRSSTVTWPNVLATQYSTQYRFGWDEIWPDLSDFLNNN